MRDFLRFYKEDGCFEPDYTSWMKWLASKLSSQGLTGVRVNKTRIFVEGESAGGHAAIIALFLNADRVTGTGIPIKAALLRYPMLKHYARSFVGDTIDYMGETHTKAQLIERADKIKHVIDELEALQIVPTCTRADAPFHMCNAFLLSVLSPRWQMSFQRQHNGGKKNDSFDIKDCLERARDSGDKVEHDMLPPIYMYHGTKDANCNIDDSRVFRETLIRNYPVRYRNANTVVLAEVAELAKGSVAPCRFDHVGHAFDYDLEEGLEAWLKEAYTWVHELW
jgi:acetyl esterase/lipase